MWSPTVGGRRTALAPVGTPAGTYGVKTTFAEAGKVGVWSKTDSVTEFERPQQGEKS
jgi:hypothetical protein